MYCVRGDAHAGGGLCGGHRTGIDANIAYRRHDYRQCRRNEIESVGSPAPVAAVCNPRHEV